MDTSRRDLSGLGRLGAGVPRPQGPAIAVATSYPVDFRNTLAATAATAEHMTRLARTSSPSLQVQTALADALSLITASPWETPRDQELRIAEGVFKWIKGHILFVRDEDQIDQGAEGRELLISPDILLSMARPQGDCDDFAMLSAAMLLGIGFTGLRFVAVAGPGIDPNAPERFGHVYLDVLIGGEWIPFDPSYGPFMAWEVDGIGKRKEFYL